ncbi:DegT/DnrJ/EryC1/StrS family aminotransferase [Candidatus Woesearchaeota archaeon]|nr:DegT/DnrJ/EryC1/StrS family aminotransferase [Candidatus Woesearchaeota archaeon]
MSGARVTVSHPLPPWPIFEADELAAVDAVLRSGKVNYWTGPACRAFEEAWSAAHAPSGRAHMPLHSLSMANGSLTMDAALRALGIGPGDEVIVSPRSYVASAMCVVLAGATPVFADVDPESGCITPATAESVRSPRTRAVIPVHIGGWPCDMPGFVRWAQSHGVHILEDCAQSHGGHIGGRALGTFGIFASWSFCQDKIMSTGGEGGMLSTSDAALFRRCWAYTQHGKDHDAALGCGPRSAVVPPTDLGDPSDASGVSNSTSTPGSFRWIVHHEGTNLRMTEMQAAIGMQQLVKMPTWSAARRRNSLIMQEALRGVPGLRVPATPDGHAHYRCVAFTTGPDAAERRNIALRELHAAGIPAMHGSCSEMYLERFFEGRGLTPARANRGSLDADGRLPNARRLGETSLTFLCHHTIDEASMRRYAEAAATTLAGCLSGQPA